MLRLTSLYEDAVAKQLSIPAGDGCWTWQGTLDTNPRSHKRARLDLYTYEGHKVLPVTRFLYEKQHGVTLAPGVKFHYCPLDQRCVSPWHNRPQAECTCASCEADRAKRRASALNSTWPTMLSHRSGLCKRGHPIEGTNVRKQERGVGCRQCNLEMHRRNYQRRREERWVQFEYNPGASDQPDRDL